MRALSILLLALLCLPVRAEVITVDRGGVSDVPGIVDQGRLHLEHGFMTYNREYGDSNQYEYGLGSSVFRYGLIQDKLEFRLANNGLIINRDELGFDNLILGAKVNFWQEGKYIPAFSLLPTWEIPLGNDELQNPGFNHNYRFIFEKYLTDKFSLLENIDLSFFSQERANGDEFTGVALPYVSGVNYALTQKLTLFSEVFGSWVLTSGFENQIGLDAGFNYAITDDLVFDLTTLYGLNSETPDFGITFGLNYRF